MADPTVTAAALGAAGNFGGGVLGFIGGLIQNHQQIKLAREQMAWNQQMREQENEWSLEQWNRQNEYNSPLASAQRLRDAGLHSAFYDVNGNAAGGLHSASTLPGTMPQLTNPMSSLGQGVSGAAQTYADIYLKGKQAKSFDADAQYKEALKQTEDQLRIGRVNLGNFQLTLAKSEAFKNEKQAEEAAASCMEIDNSIKLANEYFILEGRKFDWQQYVDYAEVIMKQMHLDNETYKIYHQVIVDYANAMSNAQNAQSNLINARANERNADTNYWSASHQSNFWDSQSRYYTIQTESADYDLQFRMDNRGLIVAEMVGKAHQAQALGEYHQAAADNYTTTMWLDGIAGIMSGAGMMTMGFAGAGRATAGAFKKFPSVGFRAAGASTKNKFSKFWKW